MGLDMIDSECNWVLCPGIKVLTSKSLTDIMILIIIFQQKISTWTIFIVFSEGRGGGSTQSSLPTSFSFFVCFDCHYMERLKVKIVCGLHFIFSFDRFFHGVVEFVTWRCNSHSFKDRHFPWSCCNILSLPLYNHQW